MFGKVRFDPTFESTVAQLKAEAVSYGEKEAIKQSNSLELNASEKSILLLAQEISYLVVGQFSDDLMATEHPNKRTAFYNELPFFSHKGEYEKHLTHLIKAKLNERGEAEQKFTFQDFSNAIKRMAG